MLAKSARSRRGRPMNLCASSPPASISAAAAAALSCCCCSRKLRHLLVAEGEPGKEPVGE
uniref:Uncharacterized protein n=1 Tax=Arundo donax TaxID=35708 RepID=A0A0A9EYT0_ARUDO